MKSLLIAFAFLMFFGTANQSQATSRKRTLFEKNLSFSVETDYIQTSGIRGALFGHFSQGNENSIIRQLQAALAKELSSLPVDSSSIQLLPLVIESSDLILLDTQTSGRPGHFGVVKVHTFEKYQVNYEIRVQVLLPDSILRVAGYDNRGEVTPTIRIEFQKYGGAWQQLAQLNHLDSNLLPLDAVDLANPQHELAKMEFGEVHQKYRYALGQSLLKTLPRAKNVLLDPTVELRVSLNFQDADGKTVSTAVFESTNRFESKRALLKQVGASGLKRFVDRFFYLQLLKSLNAKVFGNSNFVQCSRIFENFRPSLFEYVPF